MDESKLEPRVSTLETKIESLTDDLIELKDIVQTQGKNLYSAIQNLTEKISEKEKTNWSTVIAAVMLVVVLIGAVLTPVWMNFGHSNKIIDGNTLKINKILEERHKDAYLQGKRDTEISYLKERLKWTQDM